MALLVMEGFNNYSSANDLWANGWWTNDTNPPVPSTSYKRTSGAGLYVPNNRMGRTFQAATNIVTVGFAVYPLGTGGWAGVGGLFSLREGGSIHVGLIYVNATGEIAVYNNASTQFCTSATMSKYAPPNQWSFIELRVKIHDTTGYVELRINGETAASAVNIDTKNGGTGLIDNFMITGGHPAAGFDQGINAYFDDLYVVDSTGTSMNDFLGDIIIYDLVPNAAGDSAQFTASAGSNWECVDDSPNDADTTYVSSSTTGHKDLYNITTLATSPYIYAVEQRTLARKEDAGAVTIRNVIKSGTTTYNGSTAAASLTYNVLSTVLTTDPNTNSTWQKSSIDSLQIGFERVQ